MILQNEKTLIKLDETSEKLDDAKIDNKKRKVTLKRVEKIVEVVQAQEAIRASDVDQSY